MIIRVQEDDFDAAREARLLTAGKTHIGAVVSFTGLVRGDKGLKSMTLEHYPGMTEKQLEDIACETTSRWPIDEVLIIHRYGALKPGDQIVLVITASKSRRDAFDAANFLMDWLKTKAPFWKQEVGEDGKVWVEAKASDDAAADKWTQDQDPKADQGS